MTKNQIDKIIEIEKKIEKEIKNSYKKGETEKTLNKAIEDIKFLKLQNMVYKNITKQSNEEIKIVFSINGLGTTEIPIIKKIKKYKIHIIYSDKRENQIKSNNIELIKQITSYDDSSILQELDNISKSENKENIYYFSIKKDTDTDINNNYINAIINDYINSYSIKSNDLKQISELLNNA